MATDEATMTDNAAVAALDSAAPGEPEDDADDELIYARGEGDEARTQVGPTERIEMPADLQDAKVSKARNGANYEISLEVAIAQTELLALYPDGFDVTFRQIEVGAGGEIRRMSITKDADGNRHLKVVLHFAQSEVRKSLGLLGTFIAESQNKGMLVLEPAQLALDLTSRAE